MTRDQPTSTLEGLLRAHADRGTDLPIAVAHGVLVDLLERAAEEGPAAVDASEVRFDRRGRACTATGASCRALLPLAGVLFDESRPGKGLPPAARPLLGLLDDMQGGGLPAEPERLLFALREHLPPPAGHDEVLALLRAASPGAGGAEAGAGSPEDSANGAGAAEDPAAHADTADLAHPEAHADTVDLGRASDELSGDRPAAHDAPVELVARTETPDPAFDAAVEAAFSGAGSSAPGDEEVSSELPTLVPGAHEVPAPLESAEAEPAEGEAPTEPVDALGKADPYVNLAREAEADDAIPRDPPSDLLPSADPEPSPRSETEPPAAPNLRREAERSVADAAGVLLSEVTAEGTARRVVRHEIPRSDPPVAVQRAPAARRSARPGTHGNDSILGPGEDRGWLMWLVVLIALAGAMYLLFFA